MQSGLLVRKDGQSEALELVYVDPEDSIANNRGWMPKKTFRALSFQISSPETSKAYEVINLARFPYQLHSSTNTLSPIFHADIKGGTLKLDAITGELIQ